MVSAAMSVFLSSIAASASPDSRPALAYINVSAHSRTLHNSNSGKDLGYTCTYEYQENKHGTVHMRQAHLQGDAFFV